MGGIYPLVMLAHGLAGLAGPLLSGAAFDRFGSFTTALALSAAVPVVGAISYTLLSRGGEQPQE